MSHVTSVRKTVYSIQSDSLKYMKKNYSCITPKKNKTLKHQRLGVNSSELRWTFKDHWFRSRTRGETSSPGGVSVSCLVCHIRQECQYIYEVDHIFLPCYIHVGCYIVKLCTRFSVRFQIQGNRPRRF